jgi:DNA-binding CsgD family transcriptional regulator/PAS domain-containing protein
MSIAENFITSIYDCAANPALWTETLSGIRDHLGAAYVLIGITDIAPLARRQPPSTIFKNSPWDDAKLAEIAKDTLNTPGFDTLLNSDIDQTWMQMRECPEPEFILTNFYNKWVKPQGLRDCISVPFIRRPETAAFFSAASYEDRELFGDQETELLASLSPHVRRAILINDIAERNRLTLALAKSALDSLSTAVFVIEKGNRITFSNEAAERMLADAVFLRRSKDGLTTSRQGPGASALEEALARAAQGDTSIGIKGIGVPLLSESGERAAAYVLPIAGKDLRREMGNGFCSVFVAQRGEQLPMTIEVLRTIYDLTQAEARVASLIAKGDSAEMISEALGVSVNTVRTQIANSLTKTGTRNQTQLVAHIHELVPPLMS